MQHNKVTVWGKCYGPIATLLTAVEDPPHFGAVMAGHGTIGLEILEQVPDLDTVVIPFGGGALSSGVASALRPDVKVYAGEVDTAAPLAPSLAARKPVEVEYKSRFVDGMGAPHLIPGMWPLISQLSDRAIVVSLEEIAWAIRLLVQRDRAVAEGAGAEWSASCPEATSTRTSW